MKNILFFALLLTFVRSEACSGIPKSFCFIKSQRAADHIICGVVTARSSHSLQLNVIDVLRGVETRSSITIWDGTDFNCNGVVSMKAGDLGLIGDTIVAILPLITVTQNTWDVAGDYRRPYSLFETAWVNVRNDTVLGYITGPPFTPVMKSAYSVFKSYWTSQFLDCETLTIKEPLPQLINVTVQNNRLLVKSVHPEIFFVKLYFPDGRIISEWHTEDLKGQDVSQLAHGLYVVRVSSGAGIIMTRMMIF